ncbi:MAG: elongation factor P maturation arginine rhamnosyltransferase EarP [Alcaligenaceae bacterium]|nr:MAG: elongation factor P maturation arginine rhamnosyltransferase EarP [Alcaligenaceae bacterium]
MLQADVFCRVVDNFGDIGVTWRLVRQLQREHHWSTRVWVDDLKIFQRLEARVNVHALQQVIDHIEIIHWADSAPDLIPHPIVLCSFSCDLPATYIEQLHRRPALWINLEYLSAETWVEGCHGLPSLRGDGLSSYFFFPGFNANTGGLLRERDLLTRRNSWQKNLDGQRQMLDRLGVSSAALAALSTPTQAARLLTLFCYPHAPATQLLEALCADSRASIVLIPQGVVPELSTGRLGPLKQVYIERIPFVSQPEYDQLLWMADLNFVRGEDSVVRGLWTGRPLVWQIYPQTEGTHLIKLEAWLEMSGLAQEVKTLLRSWNTDPSGAADLSPQLSHALSQEAYAQWSSHALALSHTLAQEIDFAQALHDFCASKMTP